MTHIVVVIHEQVNGYLKLEFISVLSTSNN
uniref:Uncharacterized protein n=1 Tax=Anguilla anguilla TaxID=7936 RepID=A0A0E9S1F2_ANGAN